MNKIEKLAGLLSRFPGVGKKTALRFVYFLLKESPALSGQLAEELATLHGTVHRCTECGNFTDESPCPICSDPRRNHAQVCVVAHPQDIPALEASQSYFGLYHVLGGLLSPLDGIGPEQLRLHQLKQKIDSGAVREVILATSPTMEGETTARYIYDFCRRENVLFTRIAQGMPMGANFEYADAFTIAHSLKARSALSS